MQVGWQGEGLRRREAGAEAGAEGRAAGAATLRLQEPDRAGGRSAARWEGALQLSSTAAVTSGAQER